jgi:methionine-rich copper-binding protein CopC
MNRHRLSALLLPLLLGVAAPASAHAHLQSSIPASQARLSVAPGTLTLNFTEAAQLTALRLTTSGHAIPVALNTEAKASVRIVVPLPSLSPGSYEVQWRVIAQDDGHVTHGSFNFTVVGS